MEHEHTTQVLDAPGKPPLQIGMLVLGALLVGEKTGTEQSLTLHLVVGAHDTDCVHTTKVVTMNVHGTAQNRG